MPSRADLFTSDQVEAQRSELPSELGQIQYELCARMPHAQCAPLTAAAMPSGRAELSIHLFQTGSENLDGDTAFRDRCRYSASRGRGGGRKLDNRRVFMGIAVEPEHWTVINGWATTTAFTRSKLDRNVNIKNGKAWAASATTDPRVGLA
ncbi:hypothetical protein FB451DRAFT_1189814 [Mycena latifolia]|nr:hypothetical protein FB451DRAFT_1189814 [Mycena latifolia]